MGKTYSVTGWRVGYVVAQDEITEQIRNMHDFHTVTAPHPFQVALAGALALPDEFYASFAANTGSANSFCAMRSRRPE